MCVGCSNGIPICNTATCSPSVIGQLATAIGLPFVIAIALVRNHLQLIAQKYLPAIFTRPLFSNHES